MPRSVAVSHHLVKTIAIIALVICWQFQSIDGLSRIGRRHHRSFGVGRERPGALLKSRGADDNSNEFDETRDAKHAQHVPNDKGKRIVLIRHGCTYMNEYLSKDGTRWGDPHFTDVFDDDSLYRDSPLSPRGVRQARYLSEGLGRMIADGDGRGGSVIGDIQLIACSPLTRALQTMDIALSPHVPSGQRVPMIALPQASERVYLISDLGADTAVLKTQYPAVDFDSEIPDSKSSEWWYAPSSDDDVVEWRPHGQGQEYACPGEPTVAFNERMESLYDWLEAREEDCIALICHWGVIDYMTGQDFDNCEMRVIDFSTIRRTGFMLSDEDADELFRQGERSVMRDE